MCKTLKEAKTRIIKLEDSSNRNLFKIANILATVQSLKLYEEAEYKSVTAWGEKELGYRQQTVSAMCRVSARFLQGKEVSILKRKDEKDYTVSQLLELLPLEQNVLNEAIENAEINPNMTTKKLRDVVKTYKTIPELKENINIGSTNSEKNETDSVKNNDNVNSEKVNANFESNDEFEETIILKVKRNDYNVVMNILHEIKSNMPHSQDNIDKIIGIIDNIDKVIAIIEGSKV